MVSFTGYYTPAVGDTEKVTTEMNINKLVTSTPKPSFDEVLVKLRKAQVELENRRRAAQLAKERELAQAREVQPAQVAPAPTGNCATWLAAAGVTDIANAMWIITRESGCNPLAVNAASGACGIAQALPCSKMGCVYGDAVCQIRWMQGYVNSRYGGWAGAAAFWRTHNWY